MKRFVLPLLILAMAALLPVAVFAQAGDTIVIRGFGNITGFNPLLTSDGASVQAYELLWPSPFKTDSFTGAPVPALTTWTVSDDGLTYTFTIKDGAQWSDGTPITADDMIFSFNAIMSPDINTVLESNVSSVDHISKVDDKTYEIVLKGVDCSALPLFGGIPFLPSHKFAADLSDFETNIENTQPDISGGPYILDSWSPDESQNFHANETYYDGAPKIPFLVNKVVGDQAVAVQGIQSGDLDYTYFQGDLFQQIADKSNLQYQSFPLVQANFLALNFADPNNPQPAYNEDGSAAEQTPHPLFSDITIRKAIAMSFNIDAVLDTLGTDGGTPLVGPVSPTIGWAYDNDLQRYPYDPQGALKMLQDAGWGDSDSDGVLDKDGMPLEFTVKYSNILKHFETTALLLQDQLKNLNVDDPDHPLGIKVNLELVEWANYLDEVYFGQSFDVTAMSNSNAVSPDPNDFMTLLDSRQDVPGSGNDIVSYVNPEMDKLIDQARSVPGCKQEDRAAIYHQIQQLAHDDAAYNWTYVPSVYQVANKRVGNFNPGPSWVFYGYPYYINEWTLES